MQRKHSIIDLFFTLTLFCVFAVSALIVVVIGANVYRSTVAYVTEKVRENDRAGSVQLGILPCDSSVPALSLIRYGEPQSIRTYIYFYDGALRELATTDAYAVNLDPSTGQVVAELENELFRFTAVGANGPEELIFALHSSV